MERNKVDMLVLNINSTLPTESFNENEGSLETIEIPQEKNTYTVLQTEFEIKEKMLISSLSALNKKATCRIPLGFFSHEQENRRKYIYWKSE